MSRNLQIQKYQYILFRNTPHYTQPENLPLLCHLLLDHLFLVHPNLFANPQSLYYLCTIPQLPLFQMDCFVPLMEHFKQTYGFYPKYPVADAGYGSYNNYIFCEQNGIEKYMKFPMFKKETKDQKYHEDPFCAVNFRIDEQGVMRCPNDKAFHFLYRKNVRGNQYGRKEELYECEDCSGYPYAEKCKKTDKNRTVRYKQKALSEL